MVNYGIHGKEKMLVPLLLQYVEVSINIKTNPLALYMSLLFPPFDSFFH